jgi:hypothetical protein
VGGSQSETSPRQKHKSLPEKTETKKEKGLGVKALSSNHSTFKKKKTLWTLMGLSFVGTTVIHLVLFS